VEIATKDINKEAKFKIEIDEKQKKQRDAQVTTPYHTGEGMKANEMIIKLENEDLE
jgi:hypothetical protein